MSEEELTFWGRLKSMLQKALQRLLEGLKIPGKMIWGDKEWAFVLHEAYKRKRTGGDLTVPGAADAEVMREKTGFGEMKFNDGETLGRSENDIETINAKFNEELEQQIDGKLPDGHIYKMGNPGRILLSTGVDDLPIQMNAKRLRAKEASYGHDFDLSEVRDLVRALQHPLAVFAYGDKSKAQNIIVPLQKEGKNFIVGLSLHPTVGGGKLEINSIRNVFEKNNSEWLNWISQGRTLYMDKEKIQTLIDQQRTVLADVGYLDLDSIAKVVKDFVNPKTSEGNAGDGGMLFRDGGDEKVDAAMGRVRELYEEAVRDTGGRTLLGAFARCLVSGDARRRFVNEFSESYFDYSRALERLQGAIEGGLGVKLEGFEDVWRSLNAKGSVDAAEVDMVMRRYVAPLADHIGGMTVGCSLGGRALGVDDVEVYMNAVHGLERNRVLCEREFVRGVESALRREGFSAEERVSISGGELEARRSGGGDVVYDDLYAGCRRDYSGLTALFGDVVDDRDRVEELEAAALDYIAEFEGVVGKGAVDELWSRVKGLNDFSLRKSYLSGLIGKVQYDEVVGMYAHYVPLRGWHDDYAGDIYQYISRGGGAGLPKVLRVAGGRRSRAGNILGTMAAMANGAIVEGNRNLVAQKFLNLALNYGDRSGLLMVGSQWYEEGADGELVALSPDLRRDMSAEQQQVEIERFEAEMKMRAAAGEVKLHRRAFGRELPLHIEKWQEREHSVRVLRNGVEYQVYVLGNPRAAQAFNGLTRVDGDVGKLQDLMLKWLRFKSKMQTSLSPEFILSNFQRDVLTACSSTYVKYGLGASKDFSKHLLSLLPLAGLGSGGGGGIFS